MRIFRDDGSGLVDDDGVGRGGAEQGAQERGGWRLTWMVMRTEEKQGWRDERVSVGSER